MIRVTSGCLKLRQFGAIGVKVVSEAPEGLAAVREVQDFGRLAEAILNQVPFPECSIGHDENFFGPSQTQAHRLGLDPGLEIEAISLGRHVPGWAVSAAFS